MKMEKTPRARRRAGLSLAGANFFIYGMTSAYTAFMPVYLSAHHTSIVKGYLLSIGCVVSLIAPVAVGKITDRAKSKNAVLALIALAAAALFSASYLSSGVVYLAVMLSALAFFHTPLGGLLDTVSLEGAAESGVAYGPIRMMGTVGFGVVAVIMGLLATKSLGAAFAVYPAAAALGVVCLLRAPQTPGHAKAREKLPVLPILRDRNVRLLFLLNAVGYFCFFYCQHFYNEYVLDILGLPAWVWGLHSFMNILLEIPFFFLFDKIMAKVSFRTMLGACMAVSVARYLLLPVVSTAAGILLTAALTGGWVTFITYCVTLYIKRHMPPELIASSIGLQYALPLGGGTLLADLAGGYLTSLLGIRGGLFLCAGLCALAFPCALMLKIPKKEA